MPHASSKKSFRFVQFWAARSFCKRVLNSRICQHCDVKTSTVTPTFYYFFIIFFTCYISVPSFSYNLCQVLLLWNHLNSIVRCFHALSLSVFYHCICAFLCCCCSFKPSLCRLPQFQLFYVVVVWPCRFSEYYPNRASLFSLACTFFGRKQLLFQISTL